jgi:hypothetical protein
MNEQLKHIFETFVLKANHKPINSNFIEITALSGSFHPQFMQMIVKNAKTKEDSFVEICNVTVMGDPQLIGFDGQTVKSQRGTSLTYKDQQIIDFSVFGSLEGQGLSFSFANPNSFDVEVTIILVGIDSNVDKIGQRTIGNRLLFASGDCKSQETTKLKVLAGRGGAFKARKLRIDVIGDVAINRFGNIILKSTSINLVKRPVDITLTNISVLGTTQFEYHSDSSKVCTSYFNKYRDIGFKCIGSHEKQGLIFEFYNPSNYDVRVYISLLGDAATCNMVGKE